MSEDRHHHEAIHFCFAHGQLHAVGILHDDEVNEYYCLCDILFKLK